MKWKWNAVCPTLALNEQWPAAWQQVRRHGVHTVLPATHAFIHEWNEHSCIHFVSIQQMASSEQGGAHLDQLTTQFIDPERMKGWVGQVGWPYSGWFTHISGHPSATGRAWDRDRKVRGSQTGVLPLYNAVCCRRLYQCPNVQCCPPELIPFYLFVSSSRRTQASRIRDHAVVRASVGGWSTT